MTDDPVQAAKAAEEALWAFLDSPVGWAEADLIVAVQDAKTSDSLDTVIGVFNAGHAYLAAEDAENPGKP
jgi:hypothetical protein